MLKPKVSIITATHKRPDFLRRCILAIQQQTFLEYEHIVVADHCPSAHKVYEQFKDDPRLVFSTTDGPHVYNRGGMSKNKGIEIAKGDYICYCDDDNILLPEHVELLYKKICLEEADVCYSKIYSILHITNTERSRGIKNYKRILARPIFDTTGAVLKGPVDMLACIHKKDLGIVWPLRRDIGVRAEDEIYMNNIEYLANLKKIKLVYLDEYTCIYNAHKGMSTKDKEWDTRYNNLPEGQIYVYEELVPKLK